MRARATALSMAVLVTAAFVALFSGPATAQNERPGLPPPPVPYWGYSTGSDLHVDALQAAATGPRLADTEEAFAGAAVDSTGALLSKGVVNEVSQAVAPAQAGKNAYGRGTGLELGLGTSTPNSPDLNQLILADLAQQAAPPTDPSIVTKEVGPVKGDPLVYASLLRGQARSVWPSPDSSAAHSCVIGQPISFGLGSAADAQLLDTTKANPDGTFQAPLVASDTNFTDPGKPQGSLPTQTVAQSKSYTYLAPNNDKNSNPGNPGAPSWALVTETREDIAPVTLFKGTPNEVTIEALGEWVLRARTTGGATNTAPTLDYAPGGSMTPTTPVLRIIQPNASPPSQVTNIITVQDIFGKAGFNLPVNPLVNISVGEAPRALAKPGALPDFGSKPTITANSVSGAVDVVRVNLLQPDAKGGFHAVDLRIGHMEAVANQAAPIQCFIPVLKTSDKTSVTTNTSNNTFTWTINIPTDAHALDGTACDLIGINAVDTIKQDPNTPGSNVSYVVSSATPSPATPSLPTAPTTGDTTLKWPNLGNYHPGDPPIVLTVTVIATGGSGVLTDMVSVFANLGNCTGGAAGQELVGEASLVGTGTTGAAAAGGPTIAGVGTASGPKVSAALPLVLKKQLPRTGGGSTLPALGAVFVLAGSAVLLSRRRVAAG